MNNWNEKETLVKWREDWAKSCNVYLQEKDVELISDKSNKDLGKKEIPQIHLGSYNHKLLKEGKTNSRIERYLNIIELNKQYHDLKLALFNTYKSFKEQTTKQHLEEEKQSFFDKILGKSEKPDTFKMSKEDKKELWEVLKWANETWRDDRDSEYPMLGSWSEYRKKIIKRHEMDCKERWENAHKNVSGDFRDEGSQVHNNTSKNVLKGEIAPNRDISRQVHRSTSENVLNHEIAPKNDISSNTLGIKPREWKNNDMSKLPSKVQSKDDVNSKYQSLLQEQKKSISPKKHDSR